jgi:hypothetical protein
MRSSQILFTYAAAAALALASAAPASALGIGDIGGNVTGGVASTGLGSVSGLELGSGGPSVPTASTGHAKAPTVPLSALPGPASSALASSDTKPSPHLPSGLKGHTLPSPPEPVASGLDKATSVAYGPHVGLPGLALPGPASKGLATESTKPSPHIPNGAKGHTVP